MSLRYAVLGLLAQQPASGYDLVKRFEISLVNVWTATQSQIYGELNKLADGGLIHAAAEGPRGRKEYAITAAGQQELRHWLTEVEPAQTRRSEMFLRVFLLGTVSREQAVGYIERMAQRSAEHQRGLRELDKSVPWDDEPFSTYGKLVIEYGMRMDALIIEWAEWAVGQLPG